MATALMHMRAPLAPHTAAQHNPRVCSRVVSVPRSYQSCRVAVTCPQQQCFSTRAGISGRAESSLALARHALEAPTPYHIYLHRFTCHS